MIEITNPPVYLDLGSALAAFGLIFAVYQLRKPKGDLILKIRDSWQRNLFWILGAVGLLSTLISVLLSENVFRCLPFPFGVPLFYEVAAYLFFIASPLSLLYFSTKAKRLFNEKTAQKFYSIIVQEISRTNDDGVNAALEVLLSNFRDICRAAHERNPSDETGQLAGAILDVILSDKLVVKILTTKRLDALQFIFAITEEYNISRRESGIGIPKIVQNLFYDKESFLYKHLNKEGLALSSDIYRSIFDSPVILTNFNLFGYPTLDYSMRKEISLIGIDVFLEALSRSIKAYLMTGNVPPRHINDGLSYLSEIFGDLCIKISTEEKRGVDTKYSLKDEWGTLSQIANFLGHDYPFLAYEETLNSIIKEAEKMTPEADFYSNSTINAGIANALYKAFEQLSYIENTIDTYHIILSLLHGMMSESEKKEGYRGPFEKRIWEKIAENIIHRHYPAVLRTYLEFIGFCLASDRDQRQGWVGEQAKRMRALLYVDLKPLIDASTEMADRRRMKDSLLPKSMNYHNGKFTYKFEFGQGEEKEITPPSEGTGSALEGVHLRY